MSNLNTSEVAVEMLQEKADSMIMWNTYAEGYREGLKYAMELLQNLQQANMLLIPKEVSHA